MNLPRLVLKVGRTSTLQAGVPEKLKSPPLEAQVWGGEAGQQTKLYTDSKLFFECLMFTLRIEFELLILVNYV